MESEHEIPLIDPLYHQAMSPVDEKAALLLAGLDTLDRQRINTLFTTWFDEESEGVDFPWIDKVTKPVVRLFMLKLINRWIDKKARQ